MTKLQYLNMALNKNKIDTSITVINQCTHVGLCRFSTGQCVHWGCTFNLTKWNYFFQGRTIFSFKVLVAVVVMPLKGICQCSLVEKYRCLVTPPSWKTMDPSHTQRLEDSYCFRMTCEHTMIHAICNIHKYQFVNVLQSTLWILQSIRTPMNMPMISFNTFRFYLQNFYYHTPLDISSLHFMFNSHHRECNFQQRH